MRCAGTLLLFLTFIGLLTGCGGFTATGDNPTADTGPPPFPKRTSPVRAALKAGASAQIHEGADRIHEIHIIEITGNAQSTVENEKPGDGHKYWSARVGVKNAGDAEILAGTWALTGSDGITYPRTVLMGIGSDYQDLVPIQPGSRIEGTIAFDIPKDVTPTQLQYRVNPLDEVDIYFDAP